MSTKYVIIDFEDYDDDHYSIAVGPFLSEDAAENRARIINAQIERKLTGVADSVNITARASVRHFATSAYALSEILDWIQGFYDEDES